MSVAHASSLKEIQECTMRAATSIDYDTTGLRKWKRKHEFSNPISMQRRRVGLLKAQGYNNQDPPGLQEALGTFRATKRKRAITMNETKLTAISNIPQRHYLPQMLFVNGKFTADRRLWLEGAEAFANQRYGTDDDAAATKIQNDRLARLFSAASAERLDGRKPPKISLFSTLQGKAEMRSGSSSGADRAVPEMFKELPFWPR